MRGCAKPELVRFLRYDFRAVYAFKMMSADILGRACPQGGGFVSRGYCDSDR